MDLSHLSYLEQLQIGDRYYYPTIYYYPPIITPETGELLWNLDSKNRFSTDYFVGRKEELNRLKTTFMDAGEGLTIQVITGLSGMGKTKLAQAYAHACRGQYQIVWWFEGPGNIINDFRTLAIKLQEKGYRQNTVIENLSPDILLMQIKDFFHSQPIKWLFIFDDIENNKELKRYLPEHQGTKSYGHVVVTSCNTHWPQETHPFELNELNENEAINLLFHSMNREVSTEEAKKAEELVSDAKLGRLPLTLMQAGSFLRDVPMDLNRYIENVDRVLEEVLEKMELPDDYEYEENRWANRPHPDSRRLAVTWRFWFERLRLEQPSALKWLNLCAYLAPIEIPYDLIDAILGSLDLPIFGEFDRRRKILSLLQDHSFISGIFISSFLSTFSMHNLLQYVIRKTHSIEERKKYLISLIERLNQQLKEESYDLTILIANEKLLSHCKYIFNHIEIFAPNPHEEIFMPLFTLAQKVAITHLQLRNYNAAIETFQGLIKWHGYVWLTEDINHFLENSQNIRWANQFESLLSTILNRLHLDIQSPEEITILNALGLAHFYRYQDKTYLKTKLLRDANQEEENEDLEKAAIFSTLAAKLSESFPDLKFTQLPLSLSQLALISETCASVKFKNSSFADSWLHWLRTNYRGDFDDNLPGPFRSIGVKILSVAFYYKGQHFKIPQSDFNFNDINQFVKLFQDRLMSSHHRANPYLITLFKMLSHLIKKTNYDLAIAILNLILAPSIRLYGENSLPVADIQFNLMEIACDKVKKGGNLVDNNKLEDEFEKVRYYGENVFSIYSKVYQNETFHPKNIYRLIRNFCLLQMKKTFKLSSATIKYLRHNLQTDNDVLKPIIASLLLTQEDKSVATEILDQILQDNPSCFSDPLIVYHFLNSLILSETLDKYALLLFDFFYDKHQFIREKIKGLSLKANIGVQGLIDGPLKSKLPWVRLAGMEYLCLLQESNILKEIFSQYHVNHEPMWITEALRTVITYACLQKNKVNAEIRKDIKDCAEKILTKLETEMDISFNLILVNFYFKFLHETKRYDEEFLVMKIYRALKNILLLDNLSSCGQLVKLYLIPLSEEIDLLMALLNEDKFITDTIIKILGILAVFSDTEKICEALLEVVEKFRKKTSYYEAAVTTLLEISRHFFHTVLAKKIFSKIWPVYHEILSTYSYSLDTDKTLVELWLAMSSTSVKIERNKLDIICLSHLFQRIWGKMESIDFTIDAENWSCFLAIRLKKEKWFFSLLPLTPYQLTTLVAAFEEVATNFVFSKDTPTLCVLPEIIYQKFLKIVDGKMQETNYSHLKTFFENILLWGRILQEIEQLKLIEGTKNWSNFIQNQQLYLSGKNDLSIHMQLGKIYFACEQIPSAIQHYTEAAKLSPRSISAYRNLARCYHMQGNIEKAEAAFLEGKKAQLGEKALYFQQNSNAFIAEYAHFLWLQGRFDDAIKEIKLSLLYEKNEVLQYGKVYRQLIKTPELKNISGTLIIPAASLMLYLQFLYSSSHEPESMKIVLDQLKKCQPEPHLNVHWQLVSYCQDLYDKTNEPSSTAHQGQTRFSEGF